MAHFRGGNSGVRVRMIRRMGRLGVPAVGKLCWALRHHDPAVVTAAAQALGEIGDPRAVEPLVKTLRRNLLGGSGTRQLWVGSLTWWCCLVCSVWWGWTILSGGKGSLLTLGVMLASILASLLRNHSERRSALRAACVEALGRIAEASSSLEVRSVLPDIRALARDTYIQKPGTHGTTLEALRRIEAATAVAHQLPLPASPQADTSDTLPLPARSAEAEEVGTLPRVTG